MMMMMIFHIYFLHLRCYRWLQMSGRVPELGNKGSQFHEAKQTLTVLLFERVSLRETEIERQRKCLTRGTCKHLSSFYLLLRYKQSTYLLPSPIPLICFAECTVCWQSPFVPRVLPDINIINSGARRGVLFSWKYKDHRVTWSQLHTPVTTCLELTPGTKGSVDSYPTDPQKIKPKRWMGWSLLIRSLDVSLYRED